MSSFSMRMNTRRFGQNSVGNPFGQRFQKVQPFRCKLCRDGFGDPVIAEDAVDIVQQWLGHRADLDHHIEPQPLAMTAFLLKSTDIRLDDMVAERDAVTRIGRG